jgi:NADH-quinone oxidoreductase subunit G
MSDATTTDATTEPEDVGPEEVAPKTTLSITVDGRPHEAQPGQWVIEACEDAGTYVPRFCYHPRMSSVGMCRQCLVEIDGPRGPMLVVSCTTPVAEGQVVHTESPTVKRAQEGVLEMLLANHPLDCPVCDKGGECPLQDQAFTHGPGESRYVEEKRHFEKPIPISDLVVLDRERCVLCDRCTRFADEVAGDRLIHFISRGNQTQVNTFPDEPFSSYFSGNTVQICPVGALTSRRTGSRPALGPRPDREHVHDLLRGLSGRRAVEPRRARPLPGRRQRPRQLGLAVRPRPLRLRVGQQRRARRGAARAHRRRARAVELERGDQPRCRTDRRSAGCGRRGEHRRPRRGPRHERGRVRVGRLAHDVIGTPNVYAQLADGLPLGVLGLNRATIDDVANAKTIVLLGPDLKEELPVLYLRVRDSATKRKSRILEFTPKQSGLTRYAWRSIGCEPGTQATAVREALADPEISAQLAAGEVAIVAGRANLAESPAATVKALQLLLAAVPGAKVLPALRRGNVVGALQLGMRPRPGGMDSRKMLQAAADGRIECLILLGSDPIADFPDTDLARRALAGARRIIAIDTFLTESSGSPMSCSRRVPIGRSPARRRTSRAGDEQSAARSRRGYQSRADWMIATALASSSARTSVRDRRRRHRRMAATFGVRACRRRRCVDRATACTLRLAPTTTRRRAVPPHRATAMTSGSWSAEALRPGGGTMKSRRCRTIAPGAAAHLHPLDLGRAGAACRCRRHADEPARPARPARRAGRVGAARHRLGPVQPARREHRRHHRLHGRRDRRQDREPVIALDPLLFGR